MQGFSFEELFKVKNDGSNKLLSVKRNKTTMIKVIKFRSSQRFRKIVVRTTKISYFKLKQNLRKVLMKELI